MATYLGHFLLNHPGGFVLVWLAAAIAFAKLYRGIPTW
jgi:hypothetical protein